MTNIFTLSPYESPPTVNQKGLAQCATVSFWFFWNTQQYNAMSSEVIALRLYPILFELFW